MQFEADDESEQPTEAAAKVAMRVIANAKPLAGKIAEAMWDSFSGRGPKGMWWYGNLEDVAAAMEDTGEDLASPTKDADLYRLMQLTNITVRKPSKRAKTPPLVELSFAAGSRRSTALGC